MCSHVQRLLADFADGTVSAQDSEMAEAHLAVCQACRDLAATYCDIIDYARCLPPVPVPPELLPRFLKAVRALDSHRPS